MSEIHVKENESIDSALKRFKRSCAKAGRFYACSTPARRRSGSA